MSKRQKRGTLANDIAANYIRQLLHPAAKMLGFVSVLLYLRIWVDKKLLRANSSISLSTKYMAFVLISSLVMSTLFLTKKPLLAEEKNANSQIIPVTATVVVATKSSSERSQAAADFVGDGVGDQEEINAAIQSLPKVGGTVLLMEGIFDIRKVKGTLGGVIIDRSHIVLAGQGPCTQLILAPDQNTNVIRIIGSGVGHVIIRDLYVDANREHNAAGKGDRNISHDRFEYCGIKAYCRDPRGPAAEPNHDITIQNCRVINSHRLGIMLEGSNLRVLNNILGNAGSDAVELLTGPGMIRGNTVEITGRTHVAIGSDRGNSIAMSDNIVHVKKGGDLDIAFRSWAGSHRHVISDTRHRSRSMSRPGPLME